MQFAIDQRSGFEKLEFSHRHHSRRELKYYTALRQVGKTRTAMIVSFAMLKQASVLDLKSGRVQRPRDYVVIAMRRYPRGVSKLLRDEYLKELAPPTELLDELQHEKKRLGDHNRAFAACDYNGRFGLSGAGVEHLRRLSELSRTRDVYLVCQCKGDQRCHRELLLLLARKWFGAKTDECRFDYAGFSERIPKTPTVF